MAKLPALTRTSKWREIFGVDKRSAALFRVCLGTICFIDSLGRISDARDFYSDEGIYPREAMVRSHWNYYWISFQMLSGTVFVQQILFFLTAIFAFGMLIGYKTFYSNLLCWFFVSSYQARNNLVNHGGDVYMRLILFWALFLPTSSCFSVDKMLERNDTKKKYAKSNIVVSGGSIVILTQVCLVYITSYFHKYGDEWHVTGTSTEYALMLDYFRLPLGTFLLQFPTLMKFGTFAVLYYEAAGVLLFFCPIYTGPMRTLCVFLFIAMHAAFGLCMGLGIFSFISSTAVLPMLPSWIWDDIIFPWLTPTPLIHSTIWYYSNTPGEYFAHFAKTFLLLPDTFSLSSADSTIPNEPFHWMSIQRYGQMFTRFEAFQELCKVSPLLWPLRKLLESSGRPRQIIKSIYNAAPSIISFFYPPGSLGAKKHKNKWLARNSKRFLSAVGLLFSAYIILWNFGNYGKDSLTSVPAGTHWIGYSFRVDQMWNMFSPHPPQVNWWYSIEGLQDNGMKIEIWLNGLTKWEGKPEPYDTSKPRHMGDVVGNHRWIKFYEYINWGDAPEIARLNFGRYVCREYNSRHSGATRLHTYNIFFHQEQNQINAPPLPLKTATLWSHMCYDKN